MKNIAAPNLYLLTEKDTDRVVEVLATAFVNTSPFAEILQCDKKKEQSIREVFRLIVKLNLKNGTGYALDENIHTVALWYQSKKNNTGLGDVILNGGLQLLPKVGLGTALRMLELNFLEERLLDKTMKGEYYYLAFLATDPKMQGQGYAKTLMEAILSWMDDYGQPQYLNTHVPRNVQFYESLGFEKLDGYVSNKYGIKSHAMVRKVIKP